MRVLLVFMAVFLFADDTKEILSLINSLEKTKTKYVPLQQIYNPFIDKKGSKNKYKKDTYIPRQHKVIEHKVSSRYSLEVVFQNRVRINNNWYEIGNKLDGYVIISKNNKIYLSRNGRVLSLDRKMVLKVR